MTNETKILIGIGAVTAAIMAAGVFFLSKPAATDLSSARQVNQDILIRPDSQQTGPKAAKVTFVEFGDLQCPACASAQPVINKIKDEYKDRVKFVFRHYPLPQHKNAFLAALAAEAAGEQKKFWEYHDVLYEKQTEWDEETKALELFVKYAKDLKLNLEQFRKAVETEKFKDKILKDEQDGATAAIRYTPTFFINGRILEGAASYDALKSVIESELKK